jgi:hypothetical protein
LQRSAELYRNGLERLDDNWIERVRRVKILFQTHPYAEDLDLFGTGSLLNLPRRTRVGENTRAQWL